MADPRDKFEALTLAWLMVMSVFAMTVTFAGVSAAANTLVVDDDDPNNYDTIQGAVDDAASGDTIEIRNGTYTEQVNVTKDLTIEAASGAVLKNSDTTGGFLGSSLLVIRGGADVELTGLTFEGPWSTSRKAGIVVTEMSTLNASDLTMNKMFYDNGSGFPSGAQYHHAILVGQVRFGGSFSGDVGKTVGTLRLSDSDINEFGKAAVAAAGEKSLAVVDNVRITGSGPVSGPAQDTIHIDGAKVRVTNTRITDVIYSGSFPAGNGVSIFGPSPRVEIIDNSFERVTHAISFQPFRDFDPTSGAIDGAVVEDNGATDVRFGFEMFSESISEDKIVLRNSDLRGNVFNNSDGAIGIMTGDVENVDVSGNTFHDNDLQMWQGDEAIAPQNVLDDNDLDRAVVVDRPSSSLLPIIWSSIQDAVDSTQDGDTVLVGGPGSDSVTDGVYQEAVTVATDVTIRGIEDPLIEGRIDIRVDGVQVRHLRITNHDVGNEVEAIFVGSPGGNWVDEDAEVLIKDVTIDGVIDADDRTVEGIHVKHYDGGDPIDGVRIVDTRIRNVKQLAAGADGVKLQAEVRNVTIARSTFEDIRGRWSYGVVSTPSAAESGAPGPVRLHGNTFRNMSATDFSGVGLGIDGSKSLGFANANQVHAHYNDFLENDIDILNKDPKHTLPAFLNWYGDARADGRTLQGDVVYDAFLTAPQEDVLKGPDETQQWANDLLIPRDGGLHSVAFPGPVKGNVSQVFQELQSGETLFAYDADNDRFLSGSALADREVSSLDAFIVSVKGSGPPIRLVVDYEDDFDDSPSAPGSKAVADGWNFVGSPQYGPLSDAFSGTTAPIGKVAHLYPGPESQPIPAGESPTFVAQPDDDNRVSAYTGYWVFMNDDGEIAAVIRAGVTAREFFESVRVS